MAKVHIQDQIFKTRSLCGRAWVKIKGGEPRSDTDPPAVFNEETGSVNAATCQQCCLVLRRSKLGT